MKSKAGSKKPKALPIHLSSDEERWSVLMLVLLRLMELAEKWKLSRPARRKINPRVEKAGKAAEKALNAFVGLVLSERPKKKGP